MAGNLQTNDIVIEDLVPRVLKGQIRIPTFQRGLRWTQRDVLRLFESIAKGYPVGNLLIWNKPAPSQRVHLGALTLDAPDLQSAWYIVDGQQRITALANGLTEEGHADPRFKIFYDVNLEVFTTRESRSGTTIPLYMIFDLPKLLDLFTTSPILLGNRTFIERASNLSKVLRGFRIPIYIVEEDDPAVLRDIFDRMNNFGRQLTRAEVFSALNDETNNGSVAPASLQYSQISEAAQAATKFGAIDDDTIFLCLLARRGADISRDIRKEFSDSAGTSIDTAPRSQEFSGESSREAWLKTADALISAAQFLIEDCKIPHYSFLPYRYILITLVRFFAHFSKPSDADRRDLRRWVWRSAVIGPDHFKGSVTGTTRILCSKIEPGFERRSIENLLSTAPPGEIAARVPRASDPFKTNHAASKTIMCAMWQGHPVRIEEAVDTPQRVNQMYQLNILQDELGDSPTARDWFPMIFTSRLDSTNWEKWKLLKQSSGNRIIFNTLSASGSPLDSINAILQVAEVHQAEDWLGSHFVDSACIEYVQRDLRSEFIAHRNGIIQRAIDSFVRRMTEMDFEDTPPLSSLDMDDANDFEHRDSEGPTKPNNDSFLFDLGIGLP